MRAPAATVTSPIRRCSVVQQDYIVVCRLYEVQRDMNDEDARAREEDVGRESDVCAEGVDASREGVFGSAVVTAEEASSEVVPSAVRVNTPRGVGVRGLHGTDCGGQATALKWAHRSLPRRHGHSDSSLRRPAQTWKTVPTSPTSS